MRSMSYKVKLTDSSSSSSLSIYITSSLRLLLLPLLLSLLLGTTSEGVFRISAFPNELKQLKEQIDMGDYTLFKIATNVHTIAGINIYTYIYISFSSLSISYSNSNRLLFWKPYSNLIVWLHNPYAYVYIALLKMWFRELKEPLIPTELYQTCVDTPQVAQQILEQIPVLNKRVIIRLFDFLRYHIISYLG